MSLSSIEKIDHLFAYLYDKGSIYTPTDFFGAFYKNAHN